MVNAIINGIFVEVEPGTTILDAAKQVNIKIPTLCKHPDLPPSAGCGICIVRIKGSHKMLRACCTPLEKGMEIITHDPEIIEIRRSVIQLILANHPNDCLACGRNGTCELQELTADFGIREEAFEKCVPALPKDATTSTIVLDPTKCIKCGRCVEVCQQVQDVWALSFLDRGFDTRISPAGDISLTESPCVRCGQCSAHCPTGAIFEHDDTQKVWDGILDSDKVCVVQIAPAVRVQIGDAFGYEPGTNLTGKLYATLRRIGFEAVFDTNFGADLTIMEEGSEFVERFAKGKGAIPLITSCCPAWVDFMEKFCPDMVDHFSSAKSPHAMVGVLSKTYWAEKNNVDPSKIFMVSIMPCTAKKYEIQRSDEMYSSGHQDVDVVLTTRELARMIRQAGIDFETIPEEEPDHILGAYTGGGTIFGATGGVMEAAVRTAHFLVTGKNMENIDLEPVRGLDGIKEAEVDVEGTKVRVAVAHGLSNVQAVINKIKDAKEKGEEPPYHFVEVMACPGGCIAGGGQAYGVTDEIRRKRSEGLYQDDRDCKIRFCHENPYIKKIYGEYLKEPLSEISHKLLHTHYKARPVYRR